MGKISILRVSPSVEFDPSDTATVIPFNNVYLDTSRYYDTSLYRWTPDKSGFVLIYVLTSWRDTSQDHHITYIRRNGSSVSSTTSRIATSWNITISTFYIGRTDGTYYYDIAARTNRSTSRITTYDTTFFGMYLPDNYWFVTN